MSKKKSAFILAGCMLMGSMSALAAKTTVKLVPLSEPEKADLLFMREEEKLARDTYLTLYEKWKLNVFSNISGSEQKHMDTILGLLTKYGLPDPAASTPVGVFRNAELQSLYNDLASTGQLSALDALEVGALIEEVDIRDMVKSIEVSTHADVDKAYTSLMCGSRNHLRAFAGNIVSMTGTAYTAQVLDQALVNKIVNSPTEKCG